MVSVPLHRDGAFTDAAEVVLEASFDVETGMVQEASFDVETSSGSESRATSTAVRFGLDVHQPCTPRVSTSEWLVGGVGLTLEATPRQDPRHICSLSDKKDDCGTEQTLSRRRIRVGRHASLDRLVRDAMVSRCSG